MSCVNYFNKSKTDTKFCNGITPSSDIPSHSMTDEEIKCVGIGSTLSQWKDSWATGTCTNVFKQITHPNGKYSSTGFTNVVEDYNYMFYSYYGPYDTNNPNGGHSINSSDEMSSYLINSCSENQGVCQCVSYNMCTSCKSSEIYSDNLVRELCGCYCNNTVADLYGIDTYCEPTCANRTSSKSRNFQTGIVDFCKKKVCFLDTDQIFTFDDSCPHCSGDSCKCAISDSGNFSGADRFKSRCSKDSYIEYDDFDESTTTSSMAYLVFIFIVVLVVAIVFVMSVDEKKTDHQALDIKAEIKIPLSIKVATPVPITETPSTIKSLKKTPIAKKILAEPEIVKKPLKTTEPYVIQKEPSFNFEPKKLDEYKVSDNNYDSPTLQIR